MKKALIKPLILFFLILQTLVTIPYLSSSQIPEFGSQVMIPRDKDEIDHLFKILKDHNMAVARIWTIFDPYDQENWDFTYYDHAFDIAHKYGVGICPTLGPIGSGVSRIVEDKDQFEMASNYIKIIVNRYKDHPALHTWMLLNEPGMSARPHPLAVERFREWLKDKYGTVEAMWGNYSSFDAIEFEPEWNEGPGRAFIDWHAFWREHLRWSLEWIANEIRKWDKTTPFHANPHNMVGNLASASYDLPSWMDIIQSMGGSMHPAWHFGGFLARDQYALGAAYESDVLRGVAEPLPFWITELQGGNNLYRPPYPFSPSDKDIAQFLWTIVGSGGKSVIYWELNPSSNWSLLDFQGRPSERIQTTSDISSIIIENKSFFEEAKAYDSPITILLSLETMTVQLATDGWMIDAEKDHPGRSKDAHIMAVLGYYNAFLEMGIPVHVKHMDDFEWDKDLGKERLAILPNVTAITQEQIHNLEVFVSKGNKLIVSGLTGIYDPYRRFLPTMEEYPMQKILGGRYKEIRLPEVYGEVTLDDPEITLPYHLWVGEIENFEGEVLGKKDEKIIAIRNTLDQGEVFWVPTMIGLPAFLRENEPLAELMLHWAAPFIQDTPFRFEKAVDECLLRILENKDQYLTVITNGGTRERTCSLWVENDQLKPLLMWGRDDQVNLNSGEIVLGARETVTILWK